ncbi:hypothetical protein AAMO2058_001081700 [Amorphochlora amoebiformis]
MSEKLELVHRYLSQNGFEKAAKSMEREAGGRLPFDNVYCVNLILQGEFNQAVDYISSFLDPKRNLLALNIMFEIRKQQFMEMLRNPIKRTLLRYAPGETFASPRSFFIEKVKPLIALNQNFVKNATGTEKIYDLIHNFSDLLVMTEEEYKDIPALRGSIRSQRRSLADSVTKLLLHPSLDLRFEYQNDLKSRYLTVTNDYVTQGSSNLSNGIYKTGTRSHHARKGLKRKRGLDGRLSRDTCERVRQIRALGSISAIAIHPKYVNVLLVGTFDGHFQLFNVETGKEYAKGFIGVRGPSTVHAITKMKWDPTGTCTCVSGAGIVFHVLTWSGMEDTMFQVVNIEPLTAKTTSEGAAERCILNDFIFVPNDDSFLLVYANDVELGIKGKVSASENGYVSSPSARQSCSDEPCVSLCVVEKDADSKSAGPIARQLVYGVTMLGDIVCWDISNFDKGNTVPIFYKGVLASMLEQPVIESWKLLAIEDAGNMPAKLSKREAVSVPSKKCGDIRMLACIQSMAENTNGVYKIVDIFLEWDENNSLKKSAKREVVHRYNSELVNEAPSWVVSKDNLIVAMPMETKTWKLGSPNTCESIPLWTSRKAKLRESTPNVTRVTAVQDGKFLCTSHGDIVSIYRILL